MPDAFQTEFLPVVRKGENLELINSDTGKVVGYYHVNYIEQLPEKIHDFDSIATEASDEDQEVTDLYMKDKQLAQYRIIPLEDIEITISQPKSKKRFATKSYIHKITARTNQIAPHLTSLFVFEDEKIFFTVKNPTKYTRPMNRILYYGWRFCVTKLPTAPPVFTTIPVEGA